MERSGNDIGMTREELLARIAELESVVKDLEWALDQNEGVYRRLATQNGGSAPLSPEGVRGAAMPGITPRGMTQVLVVDEDPETRARLVEALSVTGSVASEAVSVVEALHMAHNNPFDIALISLDWSGSGGMDLLRRLRALDDTICVVVMTEHGTLETAVEALRQGAYDYLVKPFDPDHLRVVMGRALERRSLMTAARERETFRQLSIRDGLTGVANHRHFCEILDQEIARSERTPRPISLLMIDIDDFKLYNDTNGHLQGDQALADVARLLSRSVRRVDIVCRYGGEEFAVLLPDTDADGASIIAQHVCDVVSEAPFENESLLPGGRLTISVGTATYPSQARRRDELIGRADEALYEAKRNGKNRVYAFTDGQPRPLE
jgi:two-component system cell cycle response regulator